MAAEARQEERRWEALWSYRANPPAARDGSHLSLDSFLGMLGLATPKKAKPTEISDEEIKRMMGAGRMGWIPPQ